MNFYSDLISISAVVSATWIHPIFAWIEVYRDEIQYRVFYSERGLA